VSQSQASAGGVSIVLVDEEVPRVEAAPGVEVRHLVGHDLMFRLMELDAGASVQIHETAQEHVVLVVDGSVRITQGERHWDATTESAAMVRAGRGFSLAALESAARCYLASTPPDVDLVRDLLHLEHADHGFD
jgi:quercetin dioxygenase-like cupin family protein